MGCNSSKEGKDLASPKPDYGRGKVNKIHMEPITDYE